MFPVITLFGNTIILYDFFNNLAIVAQLIILALFLKDYKKACTFPFIVDKYLHNDSKRKFFFGTISMYIEIVIMVVLLTSVTNLLAPIISEIFLGEKALNFFTNILTNPIFAFLLFMLFKASPLKCFDITAFPVAIGLILFKIACFFDGCCYGIEYGSTFYNYRNERYEIPVQLIEAACAVVMFIILLILRKHKKKDGTLYPSFMLMYSGSRFFSEFLRDDYPQVLGRLTGYHVQCIIGFVLGLIYLLVVMKFGTRITEFFEAKNKAYLDKKIEEYNKKYTRVHRKSRKKSKKR